MNTDLFYQKTSSLKLIIEEWFKNNPGILEQDEEVVFQITPRKKSSFVEIQLKQTLSSFDQVLALPISVLQEHMPRKGAVRHYVMLVLKDAAKCITLRDVVTKTQGDYFKIAETIYCRFGDKAVKSLCEALKKIDPSLHLGMKLS